MNNSERLIEYIKSLERSCADIDYDIHLKHEKWLKLVEERERVNFAMGARYFHHEDLELINLIRREKELAIQAGDICLSIGLDMRDRSRAEQAIQISVERLAENLAQQIQLEDFKKNMNNFLIGKVPQTSDKETYNMLEVLATM